MSRQIRYIDEFPNMDYVLELGGSDTEFKQKFIEIFKTEFASELGKYLYHIKKEEPRAAAEIVHKMKFKFTMLGMKRAFDFAEYHMEKLHVGDTVYDYDFKRVLKIVNEFLKTI